MENENYARLVFSKREFVIMGLFITGCAIAANSITNWHRDRNQKKHLETIINVIKEKDGE